MKAIKFTTRGLYKLPCSATTTFLLSHPHFKQNRKDSSCSVLLSSWKVRSQPSVVDPKAVAYWLGRL